MTLALVLAPGAPARAASHHAEPPFPLLTDYFKTGEVRAAHPSTPGKAVYHGLLHSDGVRIATFDLARARGHDHQTARFLSEVGLLHDWDPDRPPGTPARVDETIALLRADYAGAAPLVRGAKVSILKQRFKWTPVELETAIAMIQRTAFPFDPATAIKYERMLRALPAKEQALALTEGAMLSEYADKGSTYFRRRFAQAARAGIGLANEYTRLNATQGKPGVKFADLRPSAFLEQLGLGDAFTHDRAIAKRLKINATFLGRDQVFELLPSWGRQYKTNLHGYRVVESGLARGRPLDLAVTAGIRATSPALRTAGKNGPGARRASVSAPLERPRSGSPRR